MKADYLNGTRFAVYQPENMYHFNSDTELLGRFMKVKKNDRFLDIGCNTAALILYAAEQGCHDLHGIDLFDEVIEQAKKNLAYNGIEAEVIRCPLQEFTAEPFDAIACNPPYFNTKEENLKSSSELIRAARHEEYLTLDELFSCVQRLLKDNGRFYLVHRASRLNEILDTAKAHHLQAVRMRIAYGSKNSRARSVLIEFTPGSGRDLSIERPVFLDCRETFGDEGKEQEE